MRINPLLAATIFVLGASTVHAAADPHTDEHGGQIFHRFLLETDAGVNQDGTVQRWDFEGWAGGDNNKFYLKSEGDAGAAKVHKAELQALYSRAVTEFWDAQAGFRQDIRPHYVTYFVAGVQGLAPMYFETEWHLFVSDKGDVSTRLRIENDFHMTRKLVIQPYLEANLFAQEVEKLEIGAGLSNIETGIQIRYEVAPNLAPYIDLRYEGKFGRTAVLARRHHERTDELAASAGLRLMF